MKNAKNSPSLHGLVCLANKYDEHLVFSSSAFGHMQRFSCGYAHLIHLQKTSNPVGFPFVTAFASELLTKLHMKEDYAHCKIIALPISLTSAVWPVLCRTKTNLMEPLMEVAFVHGFAFLRSVT